MCWYKESRPTLHYTTQGFEYSLGGEIFRWDQIDKMFLSPLFLFRISNS